MAAALACAPTPLRQGTVSAMDVTQQLNQLPFVETEISVMQAACLLTCMYDIDMVRLYMSAAFLSVNVCSGFSGGSGIGEAQV